MASDRMKKQWLDDLKKLEEKIQEIYYLNDFETAKKFEDKVDVLKQKLLSLSGNEDSYIFEEEERQIISETVKIDLEVDNYLKLNQKTKGIEVNKIRYTNQLNEISSNMEANSTQELWEKLNIVSRDWNKSAYSEVEKQTIKEEVAQIALNILESQAKKDEVINLNAINGICTKEDLVKVMQGKLIKLAGLQDDKNKINILYMAKGLTAENINDALVWKVLTNVKDIRMAELETVKDIQPLEGPEELGENEEITALAVVEKQKSWLEKISETLRKITYQTTVYTIGEITPNKGEWKNVKHILGKYPKNLNLNENQELLEIEINDVGNVKGYNLKYFDNLQKITFGNGVKSVDSYFCSCSKSLKEVICSNDLKYLGEGALSGCEKLEKVVLGTGLKEIDDGAFDYSPALKDIRLPQGLKRIGKWAFQRANIERIKIPDSVETLGVFAFEGCDNLKEIILGNGIKSIPERCFSGTNIESIKIPINVERLDPDSFSFCKNLKQVIFEEMTGGIDDNSFRSCENLKYIWFPKDKNIEASSFYGNFIGFSEKPQILYYDPDKEEEDREYNQKQILEIPESTEKENNKENGINIINIIQEAIGAGFENISKDDDIER